MNIIALLETLVNGLLARVSVVLSTEPPIYCFHNKQLYKNA